MRSFFVVTPSKEKLVLNERMKIHLFSQRLGTGSLLRLEIISKIKKIIDLKEKTFEEESLKKLPNKNKKGEATRQTKTKAESTKNFLTN